MISFFGLAESSGKVQTPSSQDAFLRPVYRRPLQSNFVIVVEAKPGPNAQAVGQNLPDSDDGTPPDLWIEANHSLGNGSLAVCDKGPPPDIGGVPGFEPPNFNVDLPSIRASLIDFACRFQVHARSDEACTVNSLGNFRFASTQVTSQTIQFCFEPAVGTEIAFPHGATILTALVRDRQGGVGDPVQIVVDVE